MERYTFIFAVLLCGCADTSFFAQGEPCSENISSVTWEDDSLGFSGMELYEFLDFPIVFNIEWAEITSGAMPDEFVIDAEVDGEVPPEVVERTSVISGGCDRIGMPQDELWGEGTYLRVPITIYVSSEDGLIFTANSSVDAIALEAESTYFFWKIVETEQPVPWEDLLYTCFEMYGHVDSVVSEVRLTFYGTPLQGLANIWAVGVSPDGSGHMSDCWRGYWGG